MVMVNINLKKIETMIKLQKSTFIALAIIAVFFLTSFDKSNTKEDIPRQAVPYQQYRIISGDGTHDLESNIKYYIRDGWDLIGGVVVEGDNFYQAIAR
jgi:hypothetical protein